ncbi:hypothetical protein SAMN05421858_4243 [Haladaptatus litoreus]|uniref:Uncharacterized protein n=1 Tax=Haladaptatus litoreus TaxID=553468 RepID=A0A1N7EH92_9EURY|nr:hypothetical protein SAMN05421858_4243 [Haladaptatus litoreus]
MLEDIEVLVLDLLALGTFLAEVGDLSILSKR